MEKQYVIDDDNKIYEVSKLDKDDDVKQFLLDNLSKITVEEIEQNKKEIIDSYSDCFGNLKYKCDGYECVYEYETDPELSDLERLEEELEEAIEINLDDENYKKFYKEAKQYGYCG